MTERAASNDPHPDDARSDVSTRSTPPRRWIRRGGLGAVVVVGVVAFAMTRGSSSSGSTESAPTASVVKGAIDKAIEDLQAQPARSAEVYSLILPSIVVIQTDRAATATANSASGLGTGVIINNQGAILTALHVVDKATSIRVSFADGTETDATVESSDPDNDIAVLTPERLPDVLVPAVLGGGLRVGDETYAVGHPLGLVGSISAGVISGLDRSLSRDSGAPLRGLIQFDAAVNPGNSGGPLLNRNGQVVGIVTALANPAKDGYFMGIGFAVPIGTAGGAAGAPRK
ncbi:MAG: trypsin-like peptidase domain-containing protein [Acidimicrobiales bacterium]